MSLDTNCVTLCGVLGGPPERKATNGGGITTFRVAVHKGDRTTWVRCACGGKVGEAMLGAKLSAGDRVALVGEISVREVQGKEHVGVWAFSVGWQPAVRPQAPEPGTDADDSPF